MKKAAPCAAFLLSLVLGATHSAQATADLPSQYPGKKSTCVIMLHGLALGAWSLRSLERQLRDAGYETYNQSYPSRKLSVHQLANQAVSAGLEHCRAQDSTEISFVTHSLGGILVRLYLQTRTIPELRRIVMLAPPNQGSEVADVLRDLPIYQAFFGDAGQQLGTQPDELIASLKPVPGEIGVIAATRSLEPWFSRVLPGPDDGKVSVAATRLAEMQDFMTLDASHTLILWHKASHHEVLHFLAHGAFSSGSLATQASSAQKTPAQAIADK